VSSEKGDATAPGRWRSEVMVNGADDVYVERKGRIEKVEGLLFEGIGDRAFET
jgi:hypothetical protein